MSIKLNKQTLLFTALVFAVIYISYSYVFNPVFSNYKKLYKEEIRVKSKIERNLDINKNRDAITENYKLLFEKYKLTEDEEDELLNTEKEIDRISRSNQLEISKIQGSAPSKTPDYVQFDFQIDCNGSLNQIGSFIFDLSKSSMLFDIHKVRIQPVGTAPNMLRASITISRIGFPEIQQ